MACINICVLFVMADLSPIITGHIILTDSSLEFAFILTHTYQICYNILESQSTYHVVYTTSPKDN